MYDQCQKHITEISDKESLSKFIEDDYFVKIVAVYSFSMGQER